MNSQQRGVKYISPKRKERGQSFCRVCYFHLPPDMRRKLYSRDEYPNNYDDAKQYLRINK
jgi:hypothetical protein